MDPATAIALAQAGIGVAQMLLGGNASVGDLLALQTTMLLKISDQITVVQKSINVVFSKLDELKLLVRTLPSNTVIELFRAEVVGAINEYKETMRTFDTDRTNRGIEFANAQNLDEFRAITSQFRTARDVLMGYHEETTIPIVSCALQAEVHCMIMQAIRDARIKEALVTYKQWFDSWLDVGLEGNLIGEMAKAETEAKKLLEDKHAERLKYQGFYCFDLIGDFDSLSGTRQNLVTSADEDLTRIQNEAQAANESGASIPELFFDLRKDNVSFSAENLVIRGRAACAATYGQLMDAQAPYRGFWPGFTGSCTRSQALLRNITDNKKKEDDAISLARLKLLSLGGFRVAALNSQSFCSKLLADLEAH